MQHTERDRGATRRRRTGRLAMVLVAAGAWSALVAPGVAGAGTSTTATTIATAKDSKVGTILVADGAPVYALKGKATCDATCQTARPPVVLPDGVTAATAGIGVEATKLGTVTARGGSLQVTYAGKPLYWSAKDTGSGHPRGVGSDKFGKWSVIVTKASPASDSGGDGNAGTGGVSF